MLRHRVRPSATNDLFLAVGRGDQLAFAAFYDRTVAMVFGILRAALGDSAGVPATERVYLQVWHTAPRFDPAGPSAYSLLLDTVSREVSGQMHDLVSDRRSVGY